MVATEERVLLVIDVQSEYFLGGKLPIVGSEASKNLRSLDRIIDLQRAFAAAGHRVVLVQHSFPANAGMFVAGTPAWEINSQILEGPYDLVIQKNIPDAFARTNLWPELRKTLVDGAIVTICGYQTHLCCQATAFSALSLGYQVEMARDAMASPDITNDAGTASGPDLHNSALVGLRQFNAVEVLFTGDIIELL